LSAYGLGLADVVQENEVPSSEVLTEEALKGMIYISHLTAI
jgi:hypothetical protein